MLNLRRHNPWARIRLIPPILIFIGIAISFTWHVHGAQQPAVGELQTLLETRADLKAALDTAIRKAERPGISTLEEFSAFLDRYLTTVPTAENWLPLRMELYYIIDSSPDNLLQDDPDFQRWNHDFVNSLGRFLDSTESARMLDTLVADHRYKIDDYIVAPSGWLTFNQFFARHIKPGKRPIADACNDRIIVSPADCTFKGQWRISNDSEVTTKGLTWSVAQLLDGSPFKDRFIGGLMMQSYLSPYDYHRYHVPVGGIIREARKIQGRVVLDVYKTAEGTLAVRDELGYQFTQERALVVIESPAGLVAVIPVGMGIVSSVNLTVAEGVSVAKGEEFGYFAFGGSDIIVLFEAATRATITVAEGTHNLQGKAIALAHAPTDQAGTNRPRQD